MATPKSKTVSNVVVVLGHFAKLFFFPVRNYRSEPSSESNLKTLRGSMAGMGWWPNQPIPSEKIVDVYKREGNPGEMAKCGPHAGGLMPDFVAEAMAARNAEWEALKISQSADDKVKLSVFVALYTEDGEGKKLIKPEYLPMACFQRGSQYFGSQVERAKGDAANPGSDPLTQVPLEVLTLTSEVERLEKQVLENEGRNIGMQPTSYRDKLRTAEKFFNLGKNQNYFRNLYSSTTGQKLHGLLRLDRLWPNLRIVARVLMEQPSDPTAAEMGEYIPYAKVNVPDLTALIRRSPGAHEKLAPGESHVTETDVDKWFRDLKRTDGNEDKVMGKDTFKALADQNPVGIVQDVMRGALSNNTDYINKYVPLAAGLNVITELAGKGHYPPLELILVKVGESMRANPSQNILFCVRDVAVEVIATLGKPAAVTEPEPEPTPAADQQ